MARASKRFRKKRRNPDGGYKRNPPLVSEVAEWALPGLAGFVGTRAITRVATSQIAKRAPRFAGHAGAIASIGTFLAAWFFLNRVKFLAKYHTPLVVGSAIATAQSLVQIYAPPWASWVIDDPMTDLSMDSASVPELADGQSVAPPGMSVIADDPNDYVYNDAYDAGRQSAPAAQPSHHQDDDGDELDMQAGGVFS